MTNVRVDARTLRMERPGGSERSITFPTLIAQTVGFAEVVAVRCEPDPYVLRDRNVFGVTNAESSVWRVDSGIGTSVCKELSIEGGHLVARLEDGRQVALDAMTGKLL